MGDVFSLHDMRKTDNESETDIICKGEYTAYCIKEKKYETMRSTGTRCRSCL